MRALLVEHSPFEIQNKLYAIGCAFAREMQKDVEKRKVLCYNMLQNRKKRKTHSQKITVTVDWKEICLKLKELAF